MALPATQQKKMRTPALRGSHSALLGYVFALTLIFVLLSSLSGLPRLLLLLSLATLLLLLLLSTFVLLPVLLATLLSALISFTIFHWFSISGLHLFWCL